METFLKPGIILDRLLGDYYSLVSRVTIANQSNKTGDVYESAPRAGIAIFKLP